MMHNRNRDMIKTIALGVCIGTVYLVILFQRFPEKIDLDDLESRTAVKCDPNIPGSGIISVSNGGRLGNLMSQYATLWAVAKRFSLQAALVPDMRRKLVEIFPKLTLGETLACPGKWTKVEVKEFLQKPAHFVKEVKTTGVILDGFPTEVPLFHQYRSELMEEFQFRPDLSSIAQSTLRALGRKNATYVGIHVRRTDYARWLRETKNGVLAGEDYFRRAMSLIRQEVPLNKVFVVTSDDARWAMRYVTAPANEDAVWVGRDGKPHVDLATLAACNHSVVSQGTYSFWAGYLAGGKAVVPDNYSNIPHGLLEDIKAASIPGWTFLNVGGYDWL